MCEHPPYRRGDPYYLNIMAAGPLRKWRFQNHPNFDRIYRRDAAPA